MADLHGLMRRLRLLALLLVAVASAFDAHALIQPQPGTQSMGDAVPIFGQSTVSACQSFSGYAAYGGCKYVVYAFAAGVSTGSSCAGTVRSGPGFCHVLQRADSGFGSNTYSTSWRTTGGACPANSTAVSGGCQCNVGWIENQTATACTQQPSELEQICAAKAGTAGGSWTVERNNATAVCDMQAGKGGGCYLELGGVRFSMEYATGWSTQASASTYTGAVCTGDANTPPATVEPPIPPQDAGAGTVEPCPGGQRGEVNGVAVCVPFGKDVNVTNWTDSTKTVTSADGSSQTTAKQNQTTCKDGVCNTTTTTTVTSRNSAGQVTGSETTTSTGQQTKGEFCAENPVSPQCDGPDDSSFGGSCGAGFTCTGDAVQCAVAQEIHRQNCKWNDTSSAEYALYQANAGKTGDQTAGLPGNDTVNLAAGSGTGGFDMTDALGAPSVGLVDLPIVVASTNVTIPFSNLNPYLAALGNLLVAVSLLLGARIVVRG